MSISVLYLHKYEFSSNCLPNITANTLYLQLQASYQDIEVTIDANDDSDVGTLLREADRLVRCALALQPHVPDFLLSELQNVCSAAEREKKGRQEWW